MSIYLSKNEQARFLGRHILSIVDFTPEDIHIVFKLAGYFEDYVKNRTQVDLMKGLILATLFFEPSTRTRLSFETGMLRLGGSVINATGTSSSLEKGESFQDMGKVVSRFADVMVLRHPLESSIHQFAEGSTVPVINAGNGSSEHPTQALLDLYSICHGRGHTEKLKVGFVGDLKFGRAAHSITQLLGLYKTHFYFISHPSLKVPPDIIKQVKAQGCKVTETDNLPDTIHDLDVLYVTRVQKERFPDLATYEAVKNCYKIDPEIMKKAKPSLSLLHPLPRLDEIAVEVDKDPRARYFEQVTNGVAIRMALLALVSGRLAEPSGEKTIGF
jgi:aspartate carbamoyltransferase catalytic subunit